jgi:hypothetical protein
MQHLGKIHGAPQEQGKRKGVEHYALQGKVTVLFHH